ncbi:MAG: hypothetical protein ABIH92_05045 [Nanoarchaeota archaeon]
MYLTPLEVIVTIFVVLAFVKIAVILGSRRKWLKYIQNFYANPNLALIVLIILAALIFYYLIQELTIVQIVAVIAFTCILFVIGLLQFPKETFALAKKSFRKAKPAQVIYYLVWLALMAWAIYAIFF